MAKLPGRAAQHLIGGLLALAWLPAAAGASVDLIGTWHVLVHYTDDNSPNPGQWRWDDRVWVFERKGSRLQWIEYPIVVFSDERGRFERRGTGQYARVLGAWEPSEGQQQSIRNGLKINTRGSKKKSLRGSDEGGWSTTARARPASASVITYQENWSIEGFADHPVFEQEDQMGSGRSETLEGVTRWETTALEEGGDALRGSFERDGTRHGTFTIRRSGAVGHLEEKTQSEIQQAASMRGLATSREARRFVREEIEASLEHSKVELPDEDLDAIVDETMTLVAGGARRDEIVAHIQSAVRQRIGGPLAGTSVLEEQDWMQRGAEHDDSARYRFPFESEVARKLIIGPRGDLAVGPMTVGGGSRSLTQNERMRNTYVFKMPVGSTVLAAREGKVVAAIDGIVAVVLHEDGSYAGYWPLGGLVIGEGDEVSAGDPLGVTGKLDHEAAHSDVGSEPQLDFGVFVARENGLQRSLKIRFDDGSPDGLYPVTGLSYGGEGTALQAR